MKITLLCSIIISISINNCSNKHKQNYNDISKHTHFEILNSNRCDTSQNYADIILTFDSITSINDIKLYVYKLAKENSIIKADIFFTKESYELKMQMGYKFLGENFESLKNLDYKNQVILNKGYFGYLQLNENHEDIDRILSNSIIEFTPLPENIVNKLKKINSN